MEGPCASRCFPGEGNHSMQKALTGGGLALGRIFQLIFIHLFALSLGEIWLWLHFLQFQTRILSRILGMSGVNYPSLPSLPWMVPVPGVRAAAALLCLETAPLTLKPHLRVLLTSSGLASPSLCCPVGHWDGHPLNWELGNS